ncbi:MAG: TlpA family protein disulfide reductase [Acidimicrobiales bacterium]|nr:TlpA family protein disulfide reductase [Acidimicrobiales bacterium]
MDKGNSSRPAPPLDVSTWFNTQAPLSLADLRGQVVVIEAFQMLCPGCVSHGLPQAQRIVDTFGGDVTVLGLHTVFEHHNAMTPVSLEAFLHEYRIGFPVGVDTHDRPGGMPITMSRYQLRGTPSLVLIDRGGTIRLNAFGHIDDLTVGAAIARLVDEAPPAASAHPTTFAQSESTVACDPDQGCAVPIDTNSTDNNSNLAKENT